MEKIKKDDSYAHILKYTGVFGGVQGLNILVGIVRNKLTTLLIGATGLGLQSLFNSTINMIVSACNFGIPTSGVQEVSEKFSLSTDTPNSQEVQDSIKMIRSWSLATAILGFIVCVFMGPLFNMWSFSWGNHTLHFMLLAPAVAFTIIGGGEIAILKATRQLRALAMSTFVVIIFSLLFSVPTFYFFGQRGIVCVLVSIALVQMISALRYSCRYYPYSVTFSPSHLCDGFHVIKLGLAFVIAGLLNSGAEFFIRSFINNRGDLDHVGFFNAGWTLAIIYAGLIFSAMESDYFPRLSAIKEREERNDCVNKQLEINVLLAGPILTIMMFSLPILIPLLYDRSFIAILGLAQFAIMSMLFKAIYIPIEYIPLSQGRSLLFLAQETFAVAILVIFEMVGYQQLELTGIGIGIAIAYLIETIAVFVFSHYCFSYVISKRAIRYLVTEFLFVAVSLSLVCIGLPSCAYWCCGLTLTLISTVTTFYQLKDKTEVLDMLRHKIMKKR